LIEYIKQQGRPFLFSTGLSPADTAAAIAALDLLDEDDGPLRRLWENTAYFQREMTGLGFDTGNTETPIVPVMLYEAERAQDFARALFDQEAIFAVAIGFPVVPREQARIRAMMSASHSRDDLDRALEGFAAVGRGMGIIG
jgi:glycine C-acetyltransferase